LDTARWCYNETAARLKRTGEAAQWKAIKTEIIHAVPERLEDAPYQVKSIGVRNACRAMSAVKRPNRELGKGLPAGQYHELIPNPRGRRVVAGPDGVRVNRDINGARGIFLRSLGDTPALREAAQEYFGNNADSVS